MSKKIVAIIAASALALSFTGCAKSQTKYDASFLDLFDTVSTIIGYADDEQTFKDNVNAVYEQLSEYNKLFEAHQPLPSEVVNFSTRITRQLQHAPIQPTSNAQNHFVNGDSTVALTR